MGQLPPEPAEGFTRSGSRRRRLGNEFYSNTLKAALSNKQFKIWSLCSEDSANLALVAENPYESLKKLTFQIKSSQDSGMLTGPISAWSSNLKVPSCRPGR